MRRLRLKVAPEEGDDVTLSNEELNRAECEWLAWLERPRR